MEPERRAKRSKRDYGEYRDGSIIALRLKNFVTYASADFYLSPTLNMIIGPNGTGKSTFVCAICLGLAGKPELLGRQKHVAQFIKEGENAASIETVLKYSANSDQTLTIKREMQRRGDSKYKEKTQWFIDGEPSTEKNVKSLLEVLNVQLNNLCCFLPQDKVASFAELKPEALLVETQRAAGGDLLSSHMKLISLETSWESVKRELSHVQERYDSLKASEEKLSLEAEKYKKYRDKMDELKLHEKLIPYAKVQDWKNRSKEVKARRDKLQSKYKAFSKLQRNAVKLPVSSQNLQADIERIKNARYEQMAQLKVYKNKIKEVEQQIEKAESQIGSLEMRSERKMRELESLRKELSADTEELGQLDEPQPEDVELLVERRNKIREQRSGLDNQLRNLEDELDELKAKKQNFVGKIRKLRADEANDDKLGIFRSLPNSRQFRDCREAIVQLRKTEVLGKSVFEPPIVCVSAKDERYVKYADFVVDTNTKLAFTAKTTADFDSVSKGILKSFNVSYRTLGMAGNAKKYTTEELRQFGFDGYLIDFMQGPEEVLQMLYEGPLAEVPVALSELSIEQLQRLQRPGDNGKPIFSRFFSGDLIYNMNKSNYGSQQIVSSTTVLRKKNNYAFSSRNGAQQAVNSNNVEHQRNLSQQLKNVEEVLQEKQQVYNTTSEERSRIVDKYELENASYNKIQAQISKREKLKNKIARKEQQVEKLSQEAEQDVTGAIRKLKKMIKSHSEKKLKIMCDIAKALVEQENYTKQLTDLELEKLDMENQELAQENLSKSLDKFRVLFEKKVAEAVEEYKKASNSEEKKKLKVLTSSYSDELRAQLAELAAQYAEQNRFTEKEVLATVSHIKHEISGLDDASSSSIEKLESVQRQLEALSDKNQQLSEDVQQYEQKIALIKAPWEQELEALVAKISNKFSQRFVAVASAGEIRLNKSSLVKDWKLELLVKFRDEADLRVLDSMIQSGGERAVSTIFFMLSLQGITNSPFRVVDEINQGMDPKNEKIVHKNMVQSACLEDNSQYFLITPKLLTGLYYHEKMAVHCIMAGVV